MSAALPRLIVITDWLLPPDRLFSQLEDALRLGPEVAVQHRNPGAPVRLFLEQGEKLTALCARYGNPLFVNGRLDIALLLKAHLHLPARSILPVDVRPHLPDERLISISVHSEAEAHAAAGADLALVSPVFRPGSKVDERPTLNIDGFARLAEKLPCPAYALGGMTPERATLLPDTAAGCAAISSVLMATHPYQQGLAFLSRWRSVVRDDRGSD